MPTQFASAKLFNSKLDTYLANVKVSRVAAINDSRRLARTRFGDLIDESLSTPTSLGAKRKLVREATWVVVFWDGSSVGDFAYLALSKGANARVISVTTTRVVNKNRHEEYDVYIGRGTPWGNPHSIGENAADRVEAIQLYRDYFEEKFVKDPEGNRAIRSLRGKVLGCHCKPAPCHGDVIANYLNGLED
jgi:hypothetical protein